MHAPFSVLLGLSLLVLASCGKSQQQPPASQVADERPTAIQPETHVQQELHHLEAGHNEHRQSGAHSEHAHEVAAHHDDGHGETEHHGGAKAGSAPPRSEHHHGVAGHAHSTEQHAGDESKRISIGDKVPNFEVTIGGVKWKLSELQRNAAMTEDGTLVFTFWCSFCHSCRHVERSLDALAKRYQGQAGVVALDASAGETTEGVAEFAKKRELTLPIALDASGSAADIFGTRVTTTTVVVDKSGVLRYRGQFGDGEHAFAEDALRAVLAGDDVPVQETRQRG